MNRRLAIKLADEATSCDVRIALASELKISEPIPEAFSFDELYVHFRVMEETVHDYIGYDGHLPPLTRGALLIASSRR